jgi:hypothetical protein
MVIKRSTFNDVRVSDRQHDCRTQFQRCLWVCLTDNYLLSLVEFFLLGEEQLDVGSSNGLHGVFRGQNFDVELAIFIVFHFEGDDFYIPIPLQFSNPYINNKKTKKMEAKQPFTVDLKTPWRGMVSSEVCRTKWSLLSSTAAFCDI